MSPDPSTIHGGGSDINPYAYVNGSPLMGVDPDGREPITLTVIVAAVVIGAVIGAGTSVAIQASTVGWDHIDWGLKGVAGSAIAGAVSGAVTAGAGSVIGGALGASTSLAGSLTTSTLSGALGAGASYVTSSALAQRSMSWGGFGKAVAAGGAGGLAGGAAGVGGSALAGEMGWSQSASQWAGGVSGAIGGSSGGLATSLAFGDQISTQTLLLSYAGGLAGAMAGMGFRGTQESGASGGAESSALPKYRDGEGGAPGVSGEGGSRGAGGGPNVEGPIRPGRYIAGDRLSAQGRQLLQRTFGRFGYDVRRTRIEFDRSVSIKDVAETNGNLLRINPDAWAQRNPYKQMQILTHEITHSVQFEMLGSSRLMVRLATERLTHAFGDVYEVPDTLANTSLSQINLVDSRYTLEGIATRMEDFARTDL